MRPAPAIAIVGRATAEGIREAAEAVETPGGYQPVQLRVAEQYVEMLGLLAKENDTISFLVIDSRPSQPVPVPRRAVGGHTPRA